VETRANPDANRGFLHARNRPQHQTGTSAGINTPDRQPMQNPGQILDPRMKTIFGRSSLMVHFSFPSRPWDGPALAAYQGLDGRDPAWLLICRSYTVTDQNRL
jgi:hypothetical protein